MNQSFDSLIEINWKKNWKINIKKKMFSPLKYTANAAGDNYN